MGRKAVVAGHICVDITPTFPQRTGTGRSVGELLVPGKLLTVGEADVHVGGAVSNTGLAMKFLGCDVRLLGKVGEDVFGHMIREGLEEYGAGDGLIVSKETSTSYSVVLALPGIDRIFLHNPGANDTFRAEDIPAKELEDAALFHFGYPSLMKSMYDNGGEELVRIFRKAKEAGAVTSLDLAAVDPASAAGQADWREILGKVLPYVDIFVPSVEELCFMLDRERFHAWQERAGGGDVTEILDIGEDVEPLAEECCGMGVKILLLKCGVPGLYFRSAEPRLIAQMNGRIELDSSAWGGRKWFEKSYRPDRVLSGTGCGDTSIAAFLTAMLNGLDPALSLHLAAATGASCVTAYDALSGLKSFGELKARIDAGWEKLA